MTDEVLCPNCQKPITTVFGFVGSSLAEGRDAIKVRHEECGQDCMLYVDVNVSFSVGKAGETNHGDSL